MSVRTIKLPYKVESDDQFQQIRSYVENYNNVLRFTYNRLKDKDFDISTRELTVLQKSMNNVVIDSHFLNSAQYEAKHLKGKDHVIFGGKQNLLLRCQGKISKEEFKQRRLQPICSIGEAIQKGNRKFRIQDDLNIMFQPDRKHHYLLMLPNLRKNYRKDLQYLKQLQNECFIPITYRLSLEYIYISFQDIPVSCFSEINVVNDRVFAIDLNPNYIGWSVIDWRSSSEYKLIDSGVISNKLLNDKEKNCHLPNESKEKKYFKNKKQFENVDSAIYLVKLATHYHCQIFSIEDLDIKTKDSGKGRRFNRLVNNQWNRTIFYQQIQKYCDRYGIVFQKVLANYSSFLGNLVYRETGLPDMVLSSIEIGRRGYEFYHQYVLKDKPKEKNIIFDNSEKSKDKIIQSLEELNYFEAFEDLKELYIKLKTLDMKYRVPLENSILNAVFSKKSIKSQVLLYST